MFQDLGGDVDRSVILADDFQARLHHVETHVVVGRFHLDGNATLETRTNTRVKRFQFPGRTVGGDDDLLCAVKQHVEQMAELVRDHLTLQELHVVDDQQVDVAQRVLQCQGIIVADGGGKAPHEIFGGQIDHARRARAVHRSIGDRLQKVRLAETDGGMDEERVEAYRASAGFGNGLGSRECHPVRRAFKSRGFVRSVHYRALPGICPRSRYRFRS